MQLNETLNLIAAQIKADAHELQAYAAADTYGGFHILETERQFPMGSAWRVELVTLYALVRHLKPDTVVEIGGFSGASATHIAAALKANGKGHLYSVDNGLLGATHGELIPTDLREWVTLVSANGEQWLVEQADNSIGLVFEDATHETALVALLSKLAMEKLQPGGILVSHDAAHDFAYVGGGNKINSGVGRAVRDGLEQAHVYFRVYLTDPSDCGLAISMKPAAKTTATPAPSEPIGNANIESVSEPPSPKPRKSKAK